MSQGANSDVREWAKDVKAGALGVDLTGTMALQLSPRLADAESADLLVAGARKGIAVAREGLKSTKGADTTRAASAPRLLDELDLAAKGTDFRASINLGKDDLLTPMSAAMAGRAMMGGWQPGQSPARTPPGLLSGPASAR